MTMNGKYAKYIYNFAVLDWLRGQVANLTDNGVYTLTPVEFPRPVTEEYLCELYNEFQSKIQNGTCPRSLSLGAFFKSDFYGRMWEDIDALHHHLMAIIKEWLPDHLRLQYEEATADLFDKQILEDGGLTEIRANFNAYLEKPEGYNLRAVFEGGEAELPSIFMNNADILLLLDAYAKSSANIRVEVGKEREHTKNKEYTNEQHDVVGCNSKGSRPTKNCIPER